MGQQQETTVTGASSTLRRIVLVLALAAVIGVIAVSNATPAFAKGRPAFGGAPDSICQKVIIEKSPDAPACFRG
jgi:hypothetical protein